MFKYLFSFLMLVCCCTNLFACIQASKQPSNMTAIEVCAYANKILNEREEFQYIGQRNTDHWYRDYYEYHAINARRLTKDEEEFGILLKPNDWIIEVKRTSIREQYLSNKWVVIDEFKYINSDFYKFDESTASIGILGSS
jgi:hypothetical protein